MEEIQPKTSTGASRTFDKKDTKAQRNDTTRRIEAEAYRICSWEDPIRSGVILAIIVGSIVITNRYTLLQIISGILTVAVSVNLTYVVAAQLSQTILADRPTTNPFSKYLENKDTELLSKENAVHYTSLGVDVAETVARALTRIIFIENTKTSAKWLGIFGAVWQISAYVPSRVIITFITISAFIVPRLYMSNKNLIDARIQQTQAILNDQMQRTQEYASTKFASAREASKGLVEKAKTSATTANPVKKVD